MKHSREIAEEKSRTSSTPLELLFHISREIASALDLSIVLQRVLILCMRNIGATSGSIIVLDDHGHPVDSIIIVGDNILDHTTNQLRITLEQGLAGWVVENRQDVLISDTSKDERWLRRPDDAENATGPKSAVSAPLTARERTVGVITLVNAQPGFFSQEDLYLLRAIADQAGTAVLNARLYAESRRQARVMKALAESATAITASLNLTEVLHRILEQISQALQVEVVSLALIDSQGEVLEFQASTSGKNHDIVGLRLKIGQDVAGWVAQEGQGVILVDAHQDPRFDPQIDRIKGLNTRAIACAPIRSHEEVIGVLEALDPEIGAFDQDALLVLAGIGSLAGSAIRHAQLFENLQTAHKRYHELFEDSIDMIIITDWEGDILEANRQTELTSGLGEDSLFNMNIVDLHTPERDKLGSDFEKLTKGETISYESILKTIKGREVPIQVHVHEVSIEGASLLQWILRDITERKHLDEVRDDLISMIYHDLRSPLANVVSSLDVLDAMLSLENPAIHSLFQIAVRSTERIQRLTSSLLDINRLEAGQPIVDFQNAHPKKIIQEAIGVIMPIAINKDQDVKVQTPEDIPLVSVDDEMIQRVLINLLENAVKYTPPQGEIRVRVVQEDNQWISISVEDTGPGIPKSDHESIFDKFSRLHSNDGPKGLGLGLAYCRLAIEGHGGRIWLETGPEGGARFTFTVPITPPDSL